MASGSSIEAPRFSSAVPAESAFSTKASPPLSVMSTLAARAIIGIVARAIRKAATKLSSEVTWSSPKFSPSMSAAILPSTSPIGLMVAIDPTRTAAARDLDHNGLPVELDEA